MSKLTEDWTSPLEKWLWIGPAMALGLYTGRLSSELLKPGLIGAILLTSLAIAVSVYGLRHRVIWKIWPLLILLGYVFYPEPDPRIAVATGLAAAIALLQTVGLPADRLPLSGRAADILSATVLSVGFLVLYVNTLSPDVLPANAGELQLVAAKWGVAHPPGYPLYTIVANLFSRLPIGPNAAYRTNLLSAITSTGALLLLYLAVFRLSGSRLAGLLTAVALGTSTTFWSQATTANVRSLTALFTAAAFYLLLLLRDRQLGMRSANPSSSSVNVAETEKPKRDHLWLQALFFLVLVLAVTHHTSLIFVGGIFALYAIYAQPSIFREPGRWPVLLLAGLIALLPLLYLPVRGAAGAIGAPENLTTVNGFVNHVLGLGFRGDLFFFDQPSVLWSRLMVMVNVLTFQFSPFVLLVMLAGLLLLFKTDRLLAIVLAASLAIHTLVAAVYRAPQTVEYMLPVYVLLAVLFGYAAGQFHRIELEAKRGSPRDKAATIIAISLLTTVIMAVFAQTIRNYDSFRQLGANTAARDYALPLLRDAPPGTILLADWHWATPLWYLQEVEGIRSDVDVEFVFPGAGPYAETWARRIRDEHAGGRPVIVTHFDPAAYDDLPLAEPLHEAFLFRQDPLRELPDGYTPNSVELAPGLQLEGYQLRSQQIEPGQELVVQIAWRTQRDLEPERKLFAHLLGPDGRLYAGDDQLASAQQDGLTVNQFRLTPLLHVPPGAYELVIGSYSSHTPANDVATSLAEIQVGVAQSKPITTNPTFRPLTDISSERALIGYDWDSTLPGRQRLYLHWSVQDGFETQSIDTDGAPHELPGWYGPWGVEVAGSSLALDRPGAYVPFGQGLVWLGQNRDNQQRFMPGRRVKLTQEFTAAGPVQRDLVVSLRLVGYEEDGQIWDWWDLDDSVPATGAIPTLKWVAGSHVDHPVFPTISAEAWPNQESEPLLLLYDAFTARQLPILDERFTHLAPWIPLGRIRVAPET